MARGSKPLFDRFAGFDLPVEADLMRSINRFPFFHTAEGTSRPRTRFQGREMINLGSNNYLGLADDERVIDATCEAAGRWGAGSTGSRTLNGHTLAHEELEELIAGFTGQEAALVFSTGYGANLGAISGLLQRGGHALTDEEAHASILDGVLRSGARLRRFDHNDVDALERLLGSGDGRPAWSTASTRCAATRGARSRPGPGRAGGQGTGAPAVHLSLRPSFTDSSDGSGAPTRPRA